MACAALTPYGGLLSQALTTRAGAPMWGKRQRDRRRRQPRVDAGSASSTRATLPLFSAVAKCSLDPAVGAAAVDVVVGVVQGEMLASDTERFGWFADPLESGTYVRYFV